MFNEKPSNRWSGRADKLVPTYNTREAECINYYTY